MPLSTQAKEALASLFTTDELRKEFFNVIETSANETVTAKTVLEYGATGDGETDDTIPLQEAIIKSAGKELFIPPGTYLCDDITITSRIIIRANGAIFKRKTVGTTAMLKIANTASQTIIDGLELNGDSKTRLGIDVEGHATLGSGASNIIIKNCDIHHLEQTGGTEAATTGIQIGGGCRNIKVLDNRIHDLAAATNGITRGTNVIKFTGQSAVKDIEIRGNYFENILPATDGDAVCVQGFDQADYLSVRIVDNHFTKIGKRCVKVMCSGVIVTDNTFDGTLDTTAFGASVAMVAVYGSFVTVAKNSMYGATTIGIEVGTSEWAVSNVIITGNNFGMPATINAGLYDIISVVGTVNNLEITDNLLVGCANTTAAQKTRFGVNIASALTNAVVAKNTIVNCKSGINLNGTSTAVTDVNIIGNIFSNVHNYGITTGNANGNTSGARVYVAGNTGAPAWGLAIGTIAKHLTYGDRTISTLAAAGSTAADAGIIVTPVVFVSAADATRGVILPDASTATTVTVINTVAQTLKVYPVGTQQIDGGGAGTAYTQGASKRVMFYSNGTGWTTLVGA